VPGPASPTRAPARPSSWPLRRHLPQPGPYVSGFVNGKPQFDLNLVPQCTHFTIPPGKVSLRIEYTELPSTWR